MIVDNSIVVLENIYRYSAEGRSRMESCVEGAKEVFTSLTASTLTTIAVFLPLGLTGGMAGMLFDDFCLTISFLILGSLVLAIPPTMPWSMAGISTILVFTQARMKTATRAPEASIPTHRWRTK
mgnify:CR=1 FL=1